MKIIIDRFEGNLALCEKEDKTILAIPKAQLPIGVKEGDVLVEENGSFSVDTEATYQRREKIAQLMNDLWE